MRKHIKLFLIISVVLLVGLFAGKKEIKAEAGFCGVGQGYRATVSVNAKVCFRQWNGIYICNNNGAWTCNSNSWTCEDIYIPGTNCWSQGNFSSTTPDSCYVSVGATSSGPSYNSFDNGCSITNGGYTCIPTHVNKKGGCWVGDPPPPDSCFPAGTKVFMEDGDQKSIEDIKVEDKVVSQSETGKRSVSTVTKLDQPVRDHMCQIKFTDGENLKLTDEHPLFTQDGWKAINPKNTFKEVPDLPVSELKKGDRVSKSDGTSAEVGSFGCWSEKIQTYNLILDNGANTYFADGFLVHNKGDPINGACAATHYNCSAGSVGDTQEYPTAEYPDLWQWQWWCNGSNGGPSVLCSENKATPINGVCGATHYNCTAGTSANNGGTSAWTWDCNGSGGGTNAVGCTENKPTSCSISINPASVDSWTVGSTEVTYSGTVSSAQNVKLWLERRDSTRVPGGASSLSTTDTDGYIWEGQYDGRYYYEVARCLAESGGSCGESQTITAPPGEYYFHCDVSTDPNKCSGNPFCPYEGLGGTADCSGWQSCSGSDNGTFDVNAILGRIQGRRVDGPVGTSTTVTVGGIGSYTLPASGDSYSTGDILPFGNPYTVVGSAIAGYQTYHSVCPNCTAHPDSSYEQGSNVGVTIPSTPAPSYYTAYVDLYWKYVPLPVAAWWQVVDGDVSTNGDITSVVPATATVPYFDDIGIGGYPGIPAYGKDSSTNLNTSRVDVSATGWLAKSGYNPAKVYNSSYFLNAIPEDTFINSLPSSIDESNIANIVNGGTATDGIYWYEYDPAANGGADLRINTVASFGGLKVVVIVKGADVYLNREISLTKGSGFFLLVAGATTSGSKGNIIVDPTVGGGGSANLEGIFVADNKFITGTKGTDPGTDSQLWIRGTVAAYGGVDLRRNLGAGNSTTPAEKFEFAPDLVLLFPRILGARNLNWQEVAP